MSRTLRRVISWVVTLALVVAVGVGVARLPGSGGVVNEIRWLLARDNIPPTNFRRASLLLRLAEEQSSGSQADLFGSLLRDEDPRVVRATLTILSDQLTPRARPAELCELFAEWFEEISLDEKIRYLPQNFVCYAEAFGAPGVDLRVVGVGEWFWSREPPRLSGDDLRWAIAATVQRNPITYLGAPALVCRQRRPWDARDISCRLQILMRGADWMEIMVFDGEDHFTPIDRDSLNRQLRLGIDELAGMLSDPIDEVRWGAARILAVAGDERALPAFREWLQTGQRLPPAATKMMTDLFGPNWRQPLESGSTTRQSGAGDGG